MEKANSFFSDNIAANSSEAGGENANRSASIKSPKQWSELNQVLLPSMAHNYPHSGVGVCGYWERNCQLLLVVWRTLRGTVSVDGYTQEYRISTKLNWLGLKEEKTQSWSGREWGSRSGRSWGRGEHDQNTMHEIFSKD